MFEQIFWILKVKRSKIDVFFFRGFSHKCSEMKELNIGLIKNNLKVKGKKLMFFLSGFSHNKCSEMKELNIGLLKNNLREGTLAYQVIVYLTLHLIY
jgi:hypothetical protein